MKKKYYSTYSAQLRLFPYVVGLGAILSLIFWLASCSSDDQPVPDPFIGEWHYNKTDEPQISANLKIQKQGIEYVITDIVINNQNWQGYSIKTKSQGIDNIGLVNDTTFSDLENLKTLGFIDCDVSEDRKTINVDSVLYIEGINGEEKYFFNQVIKKN
jgi:hypothetical protein